MSEKSKIKTRFCPSPTGQMHLGNLRTALFNFLAKADSAENQFLLRIEDTDAERSESVYTQQLMDDLKWLDLDWQEGPGCEQAHAPYFQSQRDEIYQGYYAKLLEAGDAYPCFCQPQTLSLMRKQQLAAGQPPRYDGTCRRLSKAEVAEKKAADMPYTLRFAVPAGQTVVFDDLIQGNKTFASDDLGDFIIRKEAGTPTFMFCNAVDDALMGVTHAFRGEDHLTNTPRQLMILKALKLNAPQYGHMPLIVGQDGKPLSKRNGSMSVDQLRQAGYWPIAILNYLARLGHHYDNEALMALPALSAAFSLAHIGRAPAGFDRHHLHHWQKEATLQQTNETLWDWMKTRVEQYVPENATMTFVDTLRDNILFPSEAEDWAVRLYHQVTFDETATAAIQAAGAAFFEAAVSAAETTVEPTALVPAIKAASGHKGKALFMPIRYALTGMQAGPELPKLIALLGQEKIIQRFKAAGQLC